MTTSTISTTTTTPPLMLPFPLPFLHPTLGLVSTVPGTIQMASCCSDSHSWILEGACVGRDVRASSFQWALQWFVKTNPYMCKTNSVRQCQHTVCWGALLVVHIIGEQSIQSQSWTFLQSPGVWLLILIFVPKISWQWYVQQVYWEVPQISAPLEFGLSHLVCI